MKLWPSEKPSQVIVPAVAAKAGNAGAANIQQPPRTEFPRFERMQSETEARREAVLVERN